MRALVVLLALVGAVGVVIITEIAFAVTCGEGEQCDVGSDPTKMRAMAWVTLAGVAISATFLFLRIKWATVLAAALTGMGLLVWLSLFVYVGEGSL